jgi:hypothetical protein
MAGKLIVCTIAAASMVDPRRVRSKPPFLSSVRASLYLAADAQERPS